MLQQFIPSIRTISAKTTNLFNEIENAIEQQEPDQEHIKRLQENWRKFLGIQGTRAICAIRNWAYDNLEASLPGPFVAELGAAIKLLKERKMEDAYWQIVGSTKLLVRDVDYDSLSVQKVAVITCLVSDLLEFSDSFIAYRSHEPTGHSRGVRADHAVEAVAKQGGRIEDLVSLLAEVFCDFGQELGEPKDISVSDLQSLLTNDIESANLPGICLAIWAATHGHLLGLNDQILAGVASLKSEQSKSFDVETQQYHLDN